MDLPVWTPQRREVINEEVSSAHLNGEGHLQDVLWAKLAWFTNGSTGKGEVRRAGTLGDEAPNAYTLILQGVAKGRLQV